RVAEVVQRGAGVGQEPRPESGPMGLGDVARDGEHALYLLAAAERRRDHVPPARFARLRRAVALEAGTAALEHLGKHVRGGHPVVAAPERAPVTAAHRLEVVDGELPHADGVHRLYAGVAVEHGDAVGAVLDQLTHERFALAAQRVGAVALGQVLDRAHHAIGGAVGMTEHAAAVEHAGIRAVGPAEAVLAAPR